jgi:hypothetical protein
MPAGREAPARGPTARSSHGIRLRLGGRGSREAGAGELSMGTHEVALCSISTPCMSATSLSRSGALTIVPLGAWNSGKAQNRRE